MMNLVTGRTDKYRFDSFVALLMNNYYEICATCKHYMDYRWPEDLEKYGYNTGHCLFNDEETDAYRTVYPLLVVTAESTCDKYETTFNERWQKIATKVRELIKENRGY